MPYIVDVVFDAPWHNALSYISHIKPQIGTRALCPLNKTTRKGFIVSYKEVNNKDFNTKSLKPIKEIIDIASPLTKDLFYTACEISNRFLISKGTIFSTIVPSKLAPIKYKLNNTPSSNTTIKKTSEDPAFNDKTYFNYIPQEENRWSFYFDRIINTLSKQKQAAVILPEKTTAQRFYQFLISKGLKEQTILWSPSPNKKFLNLWMDIRKSSTPFILVGSTACLFAPLCNVGLFIIDYESQQAYLLKNLFGIHLKSFAYLRAYYTNSDFIIGGIIPSSRSFIIISSKKQDIKPYTKGLKSSLQQRLKIIDVRKAPLIKGFIKGIKISHALLFDSYKLISQKKCVLWILDRLGYAGMLFCDECGYSFTCKRCGSRLHWDEHQNKPFCKMCNTYYQWDGLCPNCGGVMLMGTLPGVDAISETIKDAISPYSVIVWTSETAKSKKSKKDLLSKIKDGGLIIGTVKAFELFDLKDIAMVGWLDVDLEIAWPEYDSIVVAYQRILTSAFKGNNISERRLILQTRNPFSNLIKYIKSDWQYMWENQLKERKLYGYPPYWLLVKAVFEGKNSHLYKETAEKVLKKELIYDKIIDKFFIVSFDDKIQHTKHQKNKKSFYYIKAKDVNILKLLLKPFTFTTSYLEYGFRLSSLFIHRE